ncbi:hypothetical protein Tco_0205990 [Tanacetum coccineum]
MEKKVVELKKDPLQTQVTALVDDHLDASLGATRDEFMNFLSASITARITKQVKNQLPQILPKEVSNFAPPVIQSMVKKSLEQAKRKTSKDAEPTKGPKAKESQSGSSKRTKSKPKSSRKSVQSEEPEFKAADSDMPHDQEKNLGNDDVEPKEKVASKRDWITKPTQPQEPTDPDWNVGKTSQQGQNQIWLMSLASFADKPSKTFDELMSTPIEFSAYIMNECYKALSKKLDWENPEGGDYPFDLTKPLPLVMSGNHQKTKAACKYDLFEDMVPNIWFLVKVAYDKHVLWGILHWREQLTHVEVMRKHGYGYPKEIIVRRADNDLYIFNEGDFPRLCITDIEEMLLLKRVEDLQMGVESYQKKINVTNPETAKSDIRKRDPYTPYQDSQGFIYVDNNGRNMLMQSVELYKFSDRTLTGLRTLLDDITKNILIEYLAKIRWSTLEKKRANIMIKAIDKQLKEEG